MQLRVIDLSIAYGGIKAVRNVSMQAEGEKIVVLVGANGAGKSSIIRCTMGLTPKSGGEIWLDQARIDELPSNRLASLGLSIVPEGRRVFAHMTVLDNLLVGAHRLGNKKDMKDALEAVWGLLPVLRERKEQTAESLSGGEQQMLAIGRALMAKPNMILLDEPSLGLSPIMVQRIADFILSLNRNQGLSLVMAEQNALMGLRIAHYAYVLENGEVALEGTGKELLENDYVLRAYLGGK
jgi:branched-chain amino acid transport system ATP-binding protein